MSSAAFDTHAAANRFRRAGFTDDQVEALVDVARETTALPDVSTLATHTDLERLGVALRTDFERLEMATKADFERLELATKADLGRVESSLRSDFERLELSTKADIEKLESRMDVKFARIEEKIVNTQVQTLAIMIPAVGLIVAVSKLFH
jgi:hypothetical protein